jgi:hypothetical protein
MTVGAVLLVMLCFWAIVIFAIRVVPVIRHGRKVTLSRPKPCSMLEAQRAADRLIEAGFDAEIAETDDNGLNMWANTPTGAQVRPFERYVVRVPRRQAAEASLV